jgi:phenylacetic acid degradation operon negative regulatory protein
MTRPKTAADPLTAAIALLLAGDPPRSKSLVVSIFGDAIAPHGGQVWMQSLIELLSPFGVNDRLLRTSVFRLAQEGWLAARRDGRRSAYAIAPDAQARFERACRRIYAPPPADWDGGWTLVIGAAGIDAGARAALRKELLWEGYALVAPGVAGHPAGDFAVLGEILRRLHLEAEVYVCRAAELPATDGVAARPLRQLVGDGWDLSAVIGAYEDFIARHAALTELLEHARPTPQQAYILRTLLIHAWRRVQLHDPQLPLSLLPDAWPGERAYALAGALYRQLEAGAEDHILATLRREDAGTPGADDAFYQRFGGLPGGAPLGRRA